LRLDVIDRRCTPAEHGRVGTCAIECSALSYRYLDRDAERFADIRVTVRAMRDAVLQTRPTGQGLSNW